RPLRAEALHRPAFDRDTAPLKMRNSVRYRPVPFETQVAIAGRDRDAGDLRRLHAGSMNVELPIAETISIADRPRHQLGAHDPCVEIVGTFPIGNVNDTVIEFGRQ